MRGVCRRAATTRAQAAACATSISKAGAIWLGKHRELTRRDVSGVVEWTVCQWITTDCVFFRRGPAAHTGRRRLEPLGTVEKRLEIARAELGREGGRNGGILRRWFNLTLNEFIEFFLPSSLTSLFLFRHPYLRKGVQRVRPTFLQLISAESVVLQVLRVFTLDRV